MRSIAAAPAAPMTKIVSGINVKPPFPVALARALKVKGWEPRTLATFLRKAFGTVPGSTEEEVVMMLNGDLPPPQGKAWAFMTHSLPGLLGTRHPRGGQGQATPEVTLEALNETEKRAKHEREELVRDRAFHEAQGWSIRNPPNEWGTACWVYRVAANISAQQMAEYCNATVPSVEGWQNGRHTPVTDTVRAIHELLPDLSAAVEDGRVGKPPARDMSKPPGRPAKAAALELVTPIRKIVEEPAPSVPEPEPSAPAPVVAPAPVAVTLQPPPATAERQMQMMHEHFDAIAQEAAARVKLVAAQQRFDEARKALDDVQYALVEAEEKRKRANEELERLAAAMTGA